MTLFKNQWQDKLLTSREGKTDRATPANAPTSADCKCSRIDKFAFEHDPQKRGRPVSRDGRQTPEKKKSQAPAPGSTKTGITPASKDNRLPCFDKQTFTLQIVFCTRSIKAETDNVALLCTIDRPKRARNLLLKVAASVCVKKQLFTCTNQEKDQLAIQHCCFEKAHPPRAKLRNLTKTYLTEAREEIKLTHCQSIVLKIWNVE